MTTQHTPGPWKANADITLNRLTNHPGRHNYVEVSTTDGVIRVYGSDTDRMLAAAQLIAAAPELLAAAQRVRGISGAIGSLALDNALNQLADAIAKDTGKGA